MERATMHTLLTSAKAWWSSCSRSANLLLPQKKCRMANHGLLDFSISHCKATAPCLHSKFYRPLMFEHVRTLKARLTHTTMHIYMFECPTVFGSVILHRALHGLFGENSLFLLFVILPLPSPSRCLTQLSDSGSTEPTIRNKQA